MQQPISYEYLQAKDRNGAKDKYDGWYKDVKKNLTDKNIIVKGPSEDSSKPTTIKLDNQTKIVIKNADYFKVNGGEYTSYNKSTAPSETDDKKLMQLNSQSLVLEFTHVNDTFLLTGDATNSATDSLITRKQIGEYDMIKVPHHGYGGQVILTY